MNTVAFCAGHSFWLASEPVCILLPLLSLHNVAINVHNASGHCLPILMSNIFLEITFFLRRLVSTVS